MRSDVTANVAAAFGELRDGQRDDHAADHERRRRRANKVIKNNGHSVTLCSIKTKRSARNSAVGEPRACRLART